MVTVTPEVSRIRVLSSGRPQAGMVWKCPPTWPGPALGHAELKPSHSSALVIPPSPAPPSHGSAYWRAEQTAPKNAPKNINSAQKNPTHPIRRTDRRTVRKKVVNNCHTDRSTDH